MAKTKIYGPNGKVKYASGKLLDAFLRLGYTTEAPKPKTTAQPTSQQQQPARAQQTRQTAGQGGRSELRNVFGEENINPFQLSSRVPASRQPGSGVLKPETTRERFDRMLNEQRQFGTRAARRMQGRPTDASDYPYVERGGKKYRKMTGNRFSVGRDDVFVPDEQAQEVIDAVNEAYDERAQKTQKSRLAQAQERLHANNELIEELRKKRDAHAANVGGSAHFQFSSPGVSPMSTYGGNSAELHEASSYSSAISQLERENEMLNAVIERKGVLGGMGDALFSADTALFGLPELSESLALRRIKDKIDRGEPLTEGERALFDAGSHKAAGESLYGDMLSNGYRWGQIAGYSVPFAAEMLLTGGGLTALRVGSRLATKGAAKIAAKGLAGSIGRGLVKGLGVTADEIGQSAILANTLGAGRTWADIERRNAGTPMGYDEQGNPVFEGGKSRARSIWEGQGAATLERYSEKLGNHMHLIGDAAKWGGKKIAGSRGAQWLSGKADELRGSRVGKMYSRMSNSDVAQAAKWLSGKMNFNGYIPEVLEEEANIVMNSLLVGDNQLSDLVDKETQLDIWGGMAVTSGFLGGANVAMGGLYSASSRAYRRNVKNQLHKADLVAGLRLTDYRWRGLRERIDNATFEETPLILSEVLASDEYATEEKRAVMQYAEALSKFRGLNLSENAIANGGGASPMDAEAYAHRLAGAEATADERANIRARSEAAAARVKAEFGISDSVDLEDWLKTYGETRGEQMQNLFPDEATPQDNADVKMVLDYINARETYEGMLEGVEDATEAAVLRSNMIVSDNTAPDGNIYMGTTRGGNPVYVVSGTPDGATTVVVRDAATGEIQQLPASDVEMNGQIMNGEEFRAQEEARIREEAAAAAEASILGAPMFNDGDVYEGIDESGQTYTLTINQNFGDGTAEITHSEYGTQRVKLDALGDLQADMDRARAVRMSMEDETEESAEGTSVAAPAVQANNPAHRQGDMVEARMPGGTVRGEIFEVSTDDGVPVYSVQWDKPVNGIIAGRYSGAELAALQPVAEQDASPENATVGNDVQSPAMAEGEKQVRIIDPREMSDEECAERGDRLREAPAVDVAEGVITSTAELSARKAAEQWWNENVPEPVFYDTEAGEVEISKKSIENSLAHRYGQPKLDAITSLVEGFENAVYLGTMQDGTRDGNVQNHYFAYPINYKGNRCYVFCRAMQDANKNRLYVHEVFIAENIKKGDTLQTAASQLHGGIALYRDILANVLDASTSSASKGTPENATSQENGQKSLQEIPTRKTKKGTEVLYHEVPVARTLEELYDGTLTQPEVDAFVEANVAESRKAAESIENTPPKMGTDLAAYKQAKAEWQGKVDEARRKADYWEDVAKEVQNITARQNERAPQSVDMPSSMSEALDGAEYAAMALGGKNGLRITPESFKAETGLGNAEQRQLTGVIASAENGGVSVEQAAEWLYASQEDNGVAFFADEAEARDAIIDVLSQGNPRGYVARSRAEAARRDAEAEMNDKEAWAQRNFRMSFEEYQAMEEQAIPAIIEQYRGFDEKTYYANLADEYEQQNERRNETDEDSRTESPRAGRGSELLQEERTADAGRIGNTGKGQQGGTTPSDVQSRVPSEDAPGAHGGGRSEDKGNLAERQGDLRTSVKTSETETDEDGSPFVLSSSGTTTFGEIKAETGLTPAPIKLSLGNSKYGLIHLERRHGEQIRNAGFKSVEEFVEYVCRNYKRIKQGENSVGEDNGTYLLQIEDAHNNTLYIELSTDGRYWGVNSGGVFRKGYGNNKKEVWSASEEQNKQSVADSTLREEEKPDIPTTPNGDVPTTSTSKSTAEVSDLQENGQKSEKKNTPTIGEQVQAAEAEVNTTPTDKQKEAGNYKKGHVQIGTFNVTIEQPKGSVRSGVDKGGKKWEVEMQNTYGYIRGTEGVDGDHIDVFLSDDIDGWDGHKVFVVDQRNADGSFDEHKVMLGFNDINEAEEAYLSNYEQGWQGLGAITGVAIEEFEKWIASSHRKTKAFAEYKSVKTAEGQSASADKDLRPKLADFNVGDVVRDYYNQKLYRIKKHSTNGVSTIAELDAEGNEMGTTAMNAHNNSRYSLAEAPVKAETPTISQESEQVSDQDNAPYNAEEARRQPLRERAKEWEAKTGVKVHLLESVDEVHNKAARRAIESGKTVTGWYNVKTGEVYLYLPHLTDAREVDETFIHEVVAHKGMRSLLGEEKYSALCDKVWSSMSAETRAEFENYPGVENIEDEAKRHRAAADEYIAHLAEKTDLTEAEKTIWEKVVAMFREALEALGLKTNISDAELSELIRASYAKMVQERQGQEAKENEFSYTGEKQDETRFRVANDRQEVFVSNAARAVEAVKQDKAAPQQWLAMIQKQGGLKAGEDKWMGLSEWLQNSKAKTLTKDEVLGFVNENRIRIDEVKYSQYGEGLIDEAAKKLEKEYKEIGWDAMRDKYPGIDDFFEPYNGEVLWSENNASIGEYEDFIFDFRILETPTVDEAINETREKYTTDGLERKREIALTVPTVEPYNPHDDIHFGNAGGGRTVAWARFGETEDSDGNKVLVIDEIQSKRHQDGREKGYIGQERAMDLDAAEERLRAAIKAFNEYRDRLKEKYDYENLGGSMVERAKLFMEAMTDDERSQFKTLSNERAEAERILQSTRSGRITMEDVTFREYDGLIEGRYGDFVSRYTADTPRTAVLADLNNQIRQRRIDDARKLVPDAPFDKNWHELAMKRMLRLAAEEGFDKVAWTTGEQQAKRYDIGAVVNRIESTDIVDYDSNLGVDLVKQVVLFTRYGNAITLRLTPEGIVRASSQYNGHHISDIVGKELGNRIMTEADLVLKEQDLRIGGEGMKGFYDKMLPSFVQKYTKKWGAKVGEVELPHVEESARKMWSVDVTPDMKEDVMEGQVMFRAKQPTQAELDAIRAEEAQIIESAKKNGTYLKAPNGKKTNLSPKQWALVRTSRFKKWFGDWEKTARIEKLRTSKDAVITGNEIASSGDLKEYKKNALEYGKTLRGKYVNADTGQTIFIGKSGVKEVLNHDYKNAEQLQSIAAIPQIIENAIYIDSAENEDVSKNKDVSHYHYYICGLKIGDVDYTVRAVVAEQPNGERYYDHKLTQIEKGTLLDSLSGITTPGFNQETSPVSMGKDMRLLSLLQTNASKVVDENGEPMVVYHGSVANNIHVFDNSKARKKHSGSLLSKTSDRTHFFIDNKDAAKETYVGFTNGKVYEVFLNIRNPKVIDYEGARYDGTGYTLKEYSRFSKRWIDIFPKDERLKYFANGNHINKDGHYNYRDPAKYQWEEVKVKDATDVSVEKAILDNAGYDGVIFKNIVDAAYNQDTVVATDYVTFASPNQIKSAEDNVGTFSDEDEDIRYRFQNGMSQDELFDALNEHAEYYNAGPSNLIAALEEYFGGELVSASSGARHAIEISGLVPVPGSKYSGEGEEYHHFEFKGPDGKTFVESVPFVKPEDVAERGIQFRDGDGMYTDDALAVENDPVAKMLGKPRFTRKQRREFAERERQRMAERAESFAKKLNLDNVEIVTDASQLQGKKQRAKGFYSKSTGKITIVIPNHTSAFDVEQTLLHEAVAHYGLRRLFGEHFDTFLDNVYQSADRSIRERINTLASKNGWNFRTATEEYLASLAEDTNFENRNAGWWSKIKSLFLGMLHKIGFEDFTGVTLTDNELRYILWRSYENLAEPGRYRSILGEAADVAMQHKLKVGNYAVADGRTYVAAEDKAENIEAVNARFNAELEAFTEENADSVVFDLGTPSGVLQSAGVADKPMKLYGSKVAKKMRNHGFSASELRDLPQAIADPIAVFNNYNEDGNRSILTELRTEQGNFLVTLSVGKGQDVDFNIVSSVFGKGDNNIINWLNSGFATYINKEKALNYLHLATPIVAASDNQELVSAANIVSNFENPQIPGVKNDEAVAESVSEVAAEGQADNIKAVNARFNAELEAFKAKTHKGLIHLGKPSAILRASGVNAEDMTLSPSVLHQHLKKHNLSADDIKNLPKSLQSPILVYKHGLTKPNIVVVTEMVVKGGKISISLKLDSDGNVVEVDNVRSVHSKDATRELERLSLLPIDALKNNLKWVDKEKVSDWLGLPYMGERQDENPKLVSVANVIETFENPQVSDVKNDEEAVLFRLSDEAREARKKARMAEEAAQSVHEAAAEQYEEAVKSVAGNNLFAWMWNAVEDPNAFRNDLAEAYLDATRSVKQLQDAIEKSYGEKLKAFENVWWALNRKSSVDAIEMERTQRDFIAPLTEALGKLIKTSRRGIKDYKEAVADVEVYLNAVHGLERNLHMAKRNARKKMIKGYEADGMKLSDAVAKADAEITAMEAKGEEWWSDERRDYSGFTEIFGKKGEKLSIEELEEKAQDFIDEFEDETGAAERDALWATIKALNNQTLKKSFECGLISREQYEGTRDMYEHYVPLRGFKNASADIYDYVTRGANSNTLQRIIKKAKGRTSQATDIFGTMVAMANSAITSGNKNRVAQHFYMMAVNHPTPLLTVSEVWYEEGADGVIRPLTASSRITNDMTMEERADAIAQFDEEMREAEAAGKVFRLKHKKGEKFGLKLTHWEEQEHCVRVMLNGAEYVIFVNGNPKAAQAINGMLSSDLNYNMVGELFRRYMAFRAKTQTSLSPEFIVSNFERDMNTIVASQFAKRGAKFASKVAKNYSRLSFGVKGRKGGIFSLISKWREGTLDPNDKVHVRFMEFVNNGGITGISQMYNINELQTSIIKKAKRSTDRNVPAAVGEWLSGGVEYLNLGIENVGRFAVFMACRESGMSLEESIFEAKEASVNFNMRGSGAMGNAWFRKYILYSNVSFQALRQQGTLAAVSAARFGIGLVAAPIISGYLFNMLMDALFADDDDDNPYYGLSEFDRYNYLNVPIINLKTFRPTGNFVKFAVSQEQRGLYAIGQIIYDLSTGRISEERAAMNILTQLNNYGPASFVDGNPEVYEDNAWQPFVRGITPTAISDITDAVAYGTDFLGRPINNMTEFNENLPEYQRMSKYTPGWVHELAKQVHNATGRPNERTWVDAWTFNPSNLYYIATQQFGGVGTFAGKVGTMGAWGYDAIVGNPTDDYEAKQFPVVSKVINFGRDDRSRMRVVRDKYYNYLREYEASNAEVNKNKKDYQEGKMSFNEYTEAMNAFAESGGAKRYMIMRNGSKAVRKMQKYLGMIDRKENPEQWKEANEKLFELQKQIVHAIEGK